MELRNLTTFIHVADLGSFTKAAEKLGYSQSTVSFQIKQLEEELGCPLFERINHTISLTQQGHALVSHAHQVCNLIEDFKEGLETETELRGHIHIVTPDSICEEMVNSRFLDFHRRYPSLFIQFSTGDTADMLDMIDHNEADFIITLDSHTYHKDYVIAKEEKIPMHFVANPQSRFAGKANLSVNDIIGQPFILTEHGQGYRKLLDRELAKRSLEITPVLEIGRTDTITSLITQCDMLSFLPDFVTKPFVEAGKLCYLDVQDFHADIWKQLIYHKNKWISRSLKAFIDYVKAEEFSN
ncbi:MAG: LysR family transcriptional regulator [Oscillospiraceae bacterium]|nr:LysR family transcriptional regulator [Oscillospiraceae bacterium]